MKAIAFRAFTNVMGEHVDGSLVHLLTSHGFEGAYLDKLTKLRLGDQAMVLSDCSTLCKWAIWVRTVDGPATCLECIVRAQ